MGQNSKKIVKRSESSVSKGVRHQKSALENKNTENSRITGLSHSGLIYLALVFSLYANYRLFQSMENLDQKIDSVQAATEKSIQKQLAQRGEIPIKITLDHQLQGDEKSSSPQRRPASSQYQPRSHSSSASRVNHFDQLDQIDISKYSVSDTSRYPKYHYFLSEQSKRTRELRARVRDIVKDFIDDHKILGADRAEYFELLSKKDLVENRLVDLQDKAGEEWKKTHRRYARNSSSRP